MDQLAPEDVRHDGLPLVDLHRHLEGSIRPSTVAELAAEHDVPLPGDVAALEVLLRAQCGDRGLLTYLSRIDVATSVLADGAACARVAYEAVADAANEGLDHLELRFSPGYVARQHGLAPGDVTAAVVEGARRAAAEHEIGLALIGILSRTFGPAATQRELDALLAHRDEITALDLAGDEAGFPVAQFAGQLEAGRRAGWRLTVHAGEAAGAPSVAAALAACSPERIGHGVRSIEDAAVVADLLRRGTVLEVSLTSNVQTGAAPSLVDHPLARLLEAGVACAVSTDNPTPSQTTIPDELAQARAAGLTPAQLTAVREHAVAAAFTDEAGRAQMASRARARARTKATR